MKTVLCHGVFDVLHAGHLAYFKEAKKYGENLIVSITADRYVNKGPGRPYFSAEKREAMVGALGIVDGTIISDEPTGIGAIRRVQPDFYVKGPDYKDFTKDVTGEILNEKAAVESYGGRLVFTDDETFSSSTLINKFFHNWTDEQKAQIEEIKSHGGMGAITKALDEVSKLKVLVVGEAIIDIYRFVNPEGISSKSPSISARFQYEEEYHGGATAIFGHLNNGFLQAGVSLRTQPGAPVKKIRYISTDKQQRIFEVTEIDDQIWAKINPDYFCTEINDAAKRNDVTLLADFGHGFFEGKFLESVKSFPGFVGLNVQTNSSNYGFNVYTKHSRYDYLCLDTREARLALHDRYEPASSLAYKIFLKDENRDVSITLGQNGSILFNKVEDYTESHKCPAFSDVVIDATGAGDAYFAITTVLLASDCNPALVPFIGNVFAGLKTKIIGNKSPVSKASLLKACEGILK